MKPGSFTRLALCLLCALLSACISNGVDTSELSPIIYLSWTDEGVIQILKVNMEGGGPEQITKEENDVFDFSSSPLGNKIAYVTSLATAQEMGGSEVWMIDSSGRNRHRLLTCERAICQRFVWHPDGRRLTYERREFDGRGIPGGPRLWWLDSVTLETVPLIAERQSVSSGASFSADGKWISYVGTPEEGVFVRNLEDGRMINVDSSLGTPGVWSPDGEFLIVRRSDTVTLHGSEGEDHTEHSHDFAEAFHLVSVSIPEGKTDLLSGDIVVDDSAPVWSPDGQWIAFGRKLPRTSMGRQIWVMRADGSDPQPLTDTPEHNHAVASWSADGEFLLFQRFAVMEEGAIPEIWITRVSSEEMQLMASPGFQPAWQP